MDLFRLSFKDTPSFSAHQIKDDRVLDIVGMVESLQMDWQLSDPKEVMLLLVRQARDRERQEAPLLTLLEELECSGAVDPVAYLHQLVCQDRLQQGMSEVSRPMISRAG